MVLNTQWKHETLYETVLLWLHTRRGSQSNNRVTPEMPDPAVPSLYHFILPLQLFHRHGKTGCCDGNVCQLLWQSSSVIWSMNYQYQKQSFFPTWTLSESHCLTADGGGAGSGALIRLSHSTSLLNIEIRWSFKVSVYFISWHSCIVGARQYTLSQQYPVPKVQTYLLSLWISYRFYKAWHDYAYNLTAKRCLFTHRNSCCTYPSITSQTRPGKFVCLRLWCLIHLGKAFMMHFSWEKEPGFPSQQTTAF